MWQGLLKLAQVTLICLAIVGMGCDEGEDEVEMDAGVPGRTADHLTTQLDAIPEYAIESAKNHLHIAYQHTSHGSQLVSGLNALMAYPAYQNRYAWGPVEGEVSQFGSLDLADNSIPGCADLSQGDELDETGVTPWVTATRNLLNDPVNRDINVVMWSWCSINGHDAQRYVDNMEILIGEYPHVHFVFMTGHAEGQGENSTLNQVHFNNELIRNHCDARGRWLFDFADIEAYDPSGGYFWNLNMQDNLDYVGGNWAVEWIRSHPGDALTRITMGYGTDNYEGLETCAHSDEPREATINCVLKGRALWWLLARIAGWDGVWSFE